MNTRDKAVRSRATPLALERSAQHLPIPIGRLAPAHARTPAPPRRWRAPVAGAGAAAAALGTWLAVTQPNVAVYEDASGVHVAGALLSAQSIAAKDGRRLFTGDAAMVLTSSPRRQVKAVAVTTVGGRAILGVCAMQRSGVDATEHCHFAAGASTFDAEDVFWAADDAWHRRYSDGRSTVIDVPRGTSLVPVPFPIHAP